MKNLSVLQCFLSLKSFTHMISYNPMITHFSLPTPVLGFPGGSVVKSPPANAGDEGSIPGLGRSPEEGNGNPLQYSCLGNPMDRGAGGLQCMGLPKSQTRLNDSTTTTSHYAEL